MKLTNLWGALCAIATGVALATAPAAAFPDKPITIVVTASVGGSIDGLTRQLQPHWEKTLGKTFVIDNKEQASGVTGVRFFMSRPDDGHTIMICTEAHVNATLEKTDTFALKDIEFINVHQFDPVSITVLADRFKSIDELIAEAKAKPNSLSWGTPPTGAPAILGKLISRDWSLPLRFVPQSNGAAADTSLLGKHIEIKLGGAASDGTELGDKIRVLAHAGPKRLPYIPDTPTLDEVAQKHGLKPMPQLGTARLVAVHASFKAKHPDRFKILADSYKAAFQSPGYQEVLKKTGQARATQFYEPAEASTLAKTLFENGVKARKDLGG